MSLKKLSWIIILVIILDQALKIFIKLNYPITFFGMEPIIDWGWFKLLFIENKGMAWGARLDDFFPFISENSAKLICEFFIKKKLKFDLVYCSSSKRTIQTLNILSEKISFKKIIKKKALYHASEDEIIHILKQTVDNYKTLLLINHEPSISELINRICLKENSEQFENLKRKFPTAAVAEISFNFNDWEKLSKVKGKLISFIKPKDLQTSKE